MNYGQIIGFYSLTKVAKMIIIDYYWVQSCKITKKNFRLLSVLCLPSIFFLPILQFLSRRLFSGLCFLIIRLLPMFNTEKFKGIYFLGSFLFTDLRFVQIERSNLYFCSSDIPVTLLHLHPLSLSHTHTHTRVIFPSISLSLFHLSANVKFNLCKCLST